MTLASLFLVVLLGLAKGPDRGVGLLGKVGLPPCLKASSNGESLSNDSVGMVIFTSFLAAAVGSQQPSLAAAMGVILPDGPDKAVTMHMTYGVVVFSIVVQGWSIARLFSGDRLSRLLR